MATSKEKCILLLTSHILLLSILPLQITPSQRQEAEALVSWKGSLSSSPALASWSLGNVSRLCQWTGIICDFEGTVTGLNLTGVGLSGTLRALGFASLPNLTVLNLGNNFLTGNIPLSLTNLTRLSSLDLSNNFLSGRIPSEIRLLTNLSLLSLYSNHFDGPIPSEIGSLTSLSYLYLDSNNLTGKLPDSICNASFLDVLNLSNNSLVGAIPPCLLLSTKIEFLLLSSNYFEGEIPSRVMNGNAFKALYLNDNRFEGPLPQAIANCRFLEILNVRNNLIRDSFPHWVETLPELSFLILGSNQFYGSIGGFPTKAPFRKLEYLDMSNNKLSGHLPAAFFDHLEAMMKISQQERGYTWDSGIQFYIDLSNNSFKGEIPSSVGKLKHLQYLDLSRNNLIGNIPPLICNLSSLEVLVLSDNILNGSIPRCFGSFSSRLSVLNLGKNQLQGSVPDTFAKGNVIDTLVFNGNRLEGPLPPTIANCGTLKILDIGNNIINDSFPQWLENLPELQVLILSYNHFHGPIESSTTRPPFPKLKIFDISNNELTGLLPVVYFERLQGMMNESQEPHVPARTARTVAMNNSIYYEASVSLVFKGFGYQIKNDLTTRTAMALSFNKFRGEIPSSIGKLKGVRYLNLSHNSLSGGIPASMENLTRLESLDLSSNQLIGEIPKQLTKLTSLAVLNLSYNNLVGPIPQGGQFPFENYSYIGNPGLCGLPLPNCRDDKTEGQTTSVQQDDDDPSLFNWKASLIGYACGMIVGLSCGSLYFNGYLERIGRVIGRK